MTHDSLIRVANARSRAIALWIHNCPRFPSAMFNRKVVTL
jgi:hypothetical protein